MTEQSNLSDFIEDDDDIVVRVIPTKKVKEFIRLLKKEITHEVGEWSNGWGAKYIIEDIIDKLAGSKLIEEKGEWTLKT